MNTVVEWLFGAALRRLVDYRVTARMRDFAAAMRGANMHVFFQDREFRYKAVISLQRDGVGIELIGRTDEQVLPSLERNAVIAAKKKVISTGEAGDCEVSLCHAAGSNRIRHAYRADPRAGRQHRGYFVLGRRYNAHALAGERETRSGDDLETTVQRYETALRESNVTVFTQDRDLRYTSISNSLAGRAVEDIIGKTDEDILTDAGRDVVIALKLKSLATGNPQNGEVAIRYDDDARPRWFDLRIEPLRDVTGYVLGLVGTAVDVTGRKTDEAHLRLLMRELTHRSKNLLAVIQAMARQTARHTNSIEGFVAQLDARLQALAASHDLLIKEGWHGASLSELAELQLQPFANYVDRQVSLKGPAVVLGPEATQALGLAFHELANNAKRFGALSVPEGRISVTWSRLAHPGGYSVELKWVESGGPAVAAPVARRFGSVVIERNLERAIAGKVNLAFLAGGVQCDILIPPEHLVGLVDARTG
jgi:PAS domain S-box-containing protein